MYQVEVKIVFEDGAECERVFELWGYATAWIDNFIENGDVLPTEIRMKLIR